MQPDLKVFDVAPNILTEFHPYMATVYFQSDPRLVESVKIGVQKLALEDKVFYGRMATGEAFIADEGRQEILDKFEPLTVDMETASQSASDDFLENCPKASAIARDVVVALIKELAQ